MAKISRNEPCTCGSGQKYKRCCLGKEDNGGLALRSVTQRGEQAIFSFVDPSQPGAKEEFPFMDYTDWDSNYAWCLHCERTYNRGEFRRVDDYVLCPYEGCDGSIFADSWDWAHVRSNHPEYPETPERGKVYPPY